MSSSAITTTSTSSSSTSPAPLVQSAVPPPGPVREEKKEASVDLPQLTVEDLADLDIDDVIMLRELDLSEKKWENFMATVTGSYRKLKKPVMKLLDLRAYISVRGKPEQVKGLAAVCLWLYAKLSEQERKELRTLPSSENTCNKLFPESLFRIYSALPVRDDLRKLYETGTLKNAFPSRVAELAVTKPREAKTTKPLPAEEEDEEEMVVRTSAEVHRKNLQLQGKKLMESVAKSALNRKSKGGANSASPQEQANEAREYVLSKLARDAGAAEASELERLLKRYKTLESLLNSKDGTEIVKVLLGSKRRGTYAPEGIKAVLKTDRLPPPLRAAFIRRFYDAVAKDEEDARPVKRSKVADEDTDAKDAKSTGKRKLATDDDDDRLMLGADETDVDLS